jgi:hypothetical protein
METDTRTATGTVTLAGREYAYAVTGAGTLRFLPPVKM